MRRMNNCWEPKEPIETEAKRTQVAAQCRVVAHLAKALVDVHEDYARLFSDDDTAKAVDHIADLVGQRTASFMEALGDMINGMDAAQPEDEWTAPIFAAAQRLWPQPLPEPPA